VHQTYDDADTEPRSDRLADPGRVHERAGHSTSPSHGRFCWACLIPDLVWVKLALLSCAVAYLPSRDDVVVTQPVLTQAADVRDSCKPSAGEAAVSTATAPGDQARMARESEVNDAAHVEPTRE
jgi:hypothetical protein